MIKVQVRHKQNEQIQVISLGEFATVDVMNMVNLHQKFGALKYKTKSITFDIIDQTMEFFIEEFDTHDKRKTPTFSDVVKWE